MNTRALIFWRVFYRGGCFNEGGGKLKVGFSWEKSPSLEEKYIASIGDAQVSWRRTTTKYHRRDLLYLTFINT